MRNFTLDALRLAGVNLRTQAGRDREPTLFRYGHITSICTAVTYINKQYFE